MPGFYCFNEEMKAGFEIFLDTEFFAEELGGTKSTGVLEKCKNIFDHCYTSVVNASEVFAMAKSSEDEEEVKKLFHGVGVLGIPFRYSVKIGEVMRVIKKKVPETLLRKQ